LLIVSAYFCKVCEPPPLYQRTVFVDNMRDLTVWGWRALLLSVILAAAVGLPNIESNLQSWKVDNSNLDLEGDNSTEKDPSSSEIGDSQGDTESNNSESSNSEGNDGNTATSDDPSGNDAQSGDDDSPQADDSAASPDSSSEEFATQESSNRADGEPSTTNDLPDGAMSGEWVVPTTQIVILSLAAIFAVGAIGSMLGAALASEGVRMGLLLAVVGPIVGLMVKNENGTFTRGRVLGYIEAHPGIHVSALRDALELANGVTAHHLYSLEKEGKIISWADARRRRYATSGIDPKRLKEIENPLTGMQQAIMQVLVESGEMGLTSIELRVALQTSRQLMSYHLRCLDEKELVASEGRGRKKTWKVKNAGRSSFFATSHL